MMAQERKISVWKSFVLGSWDVMTIRAFRENKSVFAKHTKHFLFTNEV